MNAVVQYIRPGKETSTYTEQVVFEHEYQLCTYKEFDEERSRALTQLFHQQNLLPESQSVCALRKHYFYHEYFDILEWLGPDGEVAGYYSDIATPVRKINGIYQLTDLFLDLWLVPGQPARVLDEDEFEAAIASGLVSAEWEAEARRALTRLQDETAAGNYPQAYLR
jgi:predicted RNA-binding protein associated with RNAse of E/G family